MRPADLTRRYQITRGLSPGEEHAIEMVKKLRARSALPGYRAPAARPFRTVVSRLRLGARNVLWRPGASTMLEEVTGEHP
jgi:hypothetical protein